MTRMRLRSVGIFVFVALLGLGPFAGMAFATSEAPPAAAGQDNPDRSLHETCAKSQSDLACVGICHTVIGISPDDASLIAPVPQFPAASLAYVLSRNRTTRANAIRAPPPPTT